MRRLFDRLRNWSSGRREVPVPDVSGLDDLRDYIRCEVAGGFCDDDVILRNAAEVFDGEIEADLLRSQAQALLRDALRDHRQAQSGWPDHTDCDRLDAAFDALEACGVVCRQNFTCCGVAEIGDEIAAAEDAGLHVRGYAFYHMQDTEAAVEHGDLHLNFGAVEDDADRSVSIGHEIAATLRANDLTVDWDGDLGKRIAISLNWQRRR